MRPFTSILVFGIRVYRWVLSPVKAALFGPFGRCRFTPSCSAYALEAVQTHGAWRGSWLALRRLLRCHPYGDWGEDPVPPVPEPRAVVGGPRPRACAGPPALRPARHEISAKRA